METQDKTKDVKIIPYKEKIAIKGDRNRGKEIVKYFKDLGANNRNNHKCDYDNLIYFINEFNTIDCTPLICKRFEFFTIEEVLKDQKCKESIFRKLQIKFINQLIKLKNTNTNIILLKKRS
jgi:hypothetical protein